MFRKKTILTLTSLLLIALISAGCGLSTPGGAPSDDFIATSVAATVNAQPAETAEPVATEVPALPTLAPVDGPDPVTPPASYPVSVAFVAPDRNAYFWNETMAAPIALTTSGDVESAIVSPDGTQVAFTRSTDWTNYTLEVINSDGSNLRSLILPAGFDALPRPAEAVASVPNQVHWVPGTRQLALTTRITYDGPGYQTSESLYLIDSDTSSMRVLLTVDSQWSWHYIFSPDGTKIAVSFPEGMDIYDASGVKLDRPVLAYPFINTASEYAWVASPAWSADSTELVAVVPPQEPGPFTYNDSSVYRLSADGMTGELLFNTQMTYWPTQIAAISPDLAKLAFLVHSGDTADGEFTLRLVNIDGSGITDYTTGKIYAVPSWSTDSSKFYYHNDDSGAWIGQVGLAPISIPDFNNTPNVTWIDPNRFIGASGPEGGWKLLLGTVGSPTGVIYAASMDGDGIQFTVNR